MKAEFERYRNQVAAALNDNMKYHMQKNVNDMDLEGTELNDIFQDKLYEVLRMIEVAATDIEGYAFIDAEGD